MDTRIGVFILSNNRLLRESIECMVRKKPDLDLQGAGSIQADSKNEVIKSGAEVLVVDSLQFVLERDESWGTSWNENRRINVVLVAMEDDKKHFLSAVRKGVVGYILQDAPAIEVVSAIRAVTRGEAMCPPPFIRALFDYVMSAQCTSTTAMGSHAPRTAIDPFNRTRDDQQGNRYAAESFARNSQESRPQNSAQGGCGESTWGIRGVPNGSSNALGSEEPMPMPTWLPDRRCQCLKAR